MMRTRLIISRMHGPPPGTRGRLDLEEIGRLELINGRYVLRRLADGLDRSAVERAIDETNASDLYHIELESFGDDDTVSHVDRRLTPKDGYWYALEFASELTRRLRHLGTAGAPIGVHPPPTPSMSSRRQAITVALAGAAFATAFTFFASSWAGLVLGLAAAESLFSAWLILHVAEQPTGSFWRLLYGALSVLAVIAVIGGVAAALLPQTTDAVRTGFCRFTLDGAWRAFWLGLLIPPIGWYGVKRLRLQTLRVAISIIVLAASLAVGASVFVGCMQH